jgi:hypothetical protein
MGTQVPILKDCYKCLFLSQTGQLSDLFGEKAYCTESLTTNKAVHISFPKVPTYNTSGGEWRLPPC